MKRLELIANNSVREDVIQTLETEIPGLRYTLIPVAHGRGPSDWKLGTTVWPEENFVLFTYQPDEIAERIQTLVAELKTRFPREGITVWTVRAE
jgi:hypothetical protein